MEFELSSAARLQNCLNLYGLKPQGLLIEAIPGDLSPRKYFRLKDTGSSIKKMLSTDSLMAMVFESTKPPEVEAKVVKTSDHAFFETTEFFLSNNIPVPKIFYKNFEQGVILLEDLGDRPLIQLAKGNDPRLESYYSKAVELIHKIQNIPQSSFFIFTRGFDKATYAREVSQFKDYILPSDLTDSEDKLVARFFESLVNEVSNFKNVLVHRDFHSWNLMVDHKEDLRLIDYQDALIGTRTYDLVALLHERDIDLILPQDMIERLENLFFAPLKDSLLSEIEYPLTQLQRDLKVSGLFRKVKLLRNLDSYSVWVPGTLKRIGRTLEKVKAHKQIYSDFYSLLSDRGIFN